MISTSFTFLHDTNEPHIPISEAIVPFDSIYLSISLQELCVFQIIAFQAVVNRRMARLIFQMRVCARIKEDFQILTFLLCRKPSIRHTHQRRSKPFCSIIDINSLRDQIPENIAPISRKFYIKECIPTVIAHIMLDRIDIRSPIMQVFYQRKIILFRRLDEVRMRFIAVLPRIITAHISTTFKQELHHGTIIVPHSASKRCCIDEPIKGVDIYPSIKHLLHRCHITFVECNKKHALICRRFSLNDSVTSVSRTTRSFRTRRIRSFCRLRIVLRLSRIQDRTNNRSYNFSPIAGRVCLFRQCYAWHSNKQDRRSSHHGNKSLHIVRSFISRRLGRRASLVLFQKHQKDAAFGRSVTPDISFAHCRSMRRVRTLFSPQKPVAFS